jgi:hypothetical protein
MYFKDMTAYSGRPGHKNGPTGRTGEAFYNARLFKA